MLVLGALSPFADRVLSGAGWEALGSESVAARHELESSFPGRGAYALSVVVAGAEMDDPAVARVRALLRRDPAVADVLAPRERHTIATDRRTVIVTGLAAQPPAEMVEAAARLSAPLARLSAPGVTVRLTGTAAMWADFNAANKAAMLKAEILTWPLTLALLVLAFGTLVAAGLRCSSPMSGLLGAGGLLFVFGQFADVSIWAMNFAMMFAIALGIDYALFIVVRFRAALAAGLAPRAATTETMATAGKAVLVSGLTVVAALLAVTLVPVPAFRSVPLGIGLAVPWCSPRRSRCCRRRCRASATASTAGGCACAAASITAASGSPPGAAGCGDGRCPTAPRRSRSCCCSPRPRWACVRGCRPSRRWKARRTRARATGSCSERSGPAPRTPSRSSCAERRRGRRGGGARAGRRHRPLHARRAVGGPGAADGDPRGGGRSR